jgi:hypothetical protein
MKLDDGIYTRQQVPRDEYDRMPRLNWSKLKRLGRSGAHFNHARLQPHVDTDPMKLGRITALAVFEPERFRAEVAVFEGKVRSGKDWDDFVELNPDSEIATKAMHETALAIGRAVRADKDAMRYLSGGKGEQTVLWTYRMPPAGELEGWEVQIKSRLDFITAADVVSDLKTTIDASPEAFGRTCMNLDYLAQGAMYVDGVKAVTGREMPYVFVAVEKSAPYVVQVYEVDEEQLQLGRDRYRGLLATYNAYAQASRWPGYFDGPTKLVLPQWALPTDEGAEGELGITIGGAMPAVGF